MRWFRLLSIGLGYFLRRNFWNFLVMFALLGIAALGVWQSALDNLRDSGEWSSGLWLNFATEMLGAVMTFALFEVLVSANNRQEELMRQLASKDNATSLNALQELRALGYLFDGSLEGRNLQGANLANADFSRADLRAVNLRDTEILGADFRDAAFNHKTILPDGRNWTSPHDLLPFTHPTSKSRPISHYRKRWQGKYR